jgi:hypothetical protein
VNPRPSQPATPEDLEAERQYVRRELAQLYDADGTDIWMSSPNKLLGGISPDQALAQGRWQDVLAIIAQLADGAFT